MATQPGYKHPSQRAGSYTPTRGDFKGITFRSYRAYQSEHAKAKGFTSASTRLAAPRKPSASVLASTKAFDETAAGRATRAYLDMRSDSSLTVTEATRKNHTTPSALRRYVGAALQRKGARVVATQADTIAVPMLVNVTAGSVSGVVRGSRDRDLIGSHSAALAAALTKPNPARIRKLAQFKGRSATLADGRRVDLLWNIDEAKSLARRGLLTHAGPYDVAGMPSAA